MLTWMIYALLVTIPLSAAALAAERAAKVRRAPTRWVWLAALATSLLLPMLMASVSITVPRAFTPHEMAGPIALREATFIALPSGIVDFGGAGSTASARIDTWARHAWAAGSMLLLLALVISSTLLHRRKRSWVHGRPCGEAVLIAPDAGPAVVGLVRSRIVLPVWVMQAPAERQAYVVAHERSHLDAHDPQWIMLALVALMIMPWNPLLWWQLHRLRRAIEVDCDARVLRSGRDVGAYCETLIEVGQNQSAYMGVASAMSESPSFLEQRIRIMLRKPKKWARVSALALASMSLGMAALQHSSRRPIRAHHLLEKPRH